MPWEGVGHCRSCDKVTYASRASAKRQARKLGKGVRAYPCPGDSGGFHCGHLAQDVLAGKLTRRQTYQAYDARRRESFRVSIEEQR